MNIEFFINPKMEKHTIYLGKHQMRFKKIAVEQLDLKSGDILKVGIDSEEKPIKHVYVFKSVTQGDVGFKVINRNNSTTISFKGLYDKLQIKKPQNCRYEVIEINAMKGFKIELPKF